MVNIEPMSANIAQNNALIPQSPNDPLYNTQWGLHNTGQNGGTLGIDIQVEDAWSITTGDPTIKVGVLDTGFDANHPDLSANVFNQGYDTETSSVPSVIYHQHATNCAGIIAAKSNNQIGISGVAPDVSLVSISNRLVLLPGILNKLADGFNWASQNGIDIISNSWGDVPSSSLLDDAINNALTHGRNGLGCIVVFASGNQFNNFPNYPGNSNPKLLSIGAINSLGERAAFSNYGGRLDMVAPGVGTSTTDLINGFTLDNLYNLNYSGTSASAPFVTGVAALVLSINPSLTNDEVSIILESSAQKVRTDLYTYQDISGKPNGLWSNEMGYGLVNAYEAVRLASICNREEDIVVVQNVNSEELDEIQAQNSITANNTIADRASAIYEASTVHLISGFHAKEGSFFKAINSEKCILSNVNRAPYSRNSDTEKTTYIDDESLLNEKQLIGENISIYPNPTNGLLIINSKELIIKHSLINSYGHYLLYNKEEGNSKVIRLDISSLSKGIYFLEIITRDGKVFKEKVLKN